MGNCIRHKLRGECGKRLPMMLKMHLGRKWRQTIDDYMVWLYMHVITCSNVIAVLAGEARNSIDSYKQSSNMTKIEFRMGVYGPPI